MTRSPRRRLASLVGLMTLATPGLAEVQQPPLATSAIPDRREFPLNPEVSPCENFYEHACSGVISQFKLRDDRSSHTFAFSDSRERILDKKKSFLKDLDQQFKAGAQLSPRSTNLATVYGACMDVEARKLEEQDELKQLQTRLNALKTRKDFLSFLAAQRDAAEYSFVDIGSTANQDRPEFYDSYFAVNMMSLPERSYYEKKDVAADYKAVLVAFFKTAGDSGKLAAAKAKKVLALETNFAKNYPLPAALREIFSRKSSISEADITKKYASFQLDAALSKVPDSTNIRHFIPESYAWVQKTLDTAPLEDLKALYLYQAMAPVLDDGYPEFFQTRYAFRQKHLGEPKTRPERDERCTQMVMRSFNKELDAEVLPVMFPEFPEEKFVDLAEKVRQSIITGVTQNQWLTADGKKGAIEKIAKAKLQLVKPKTEDEWYFNPSVTYDRKKPLHNTVLLDKALLERMYQELPSARNRDRWSMGPLTVNAYYSPSDNKFVMPIGILQYPFYDPALPLHVNLGAVGAVIGHELGHGIDDQGAKYDADGKLRQWMSEGDIKAFQDRGKKFVEQFNNIGHNGYLTLGENIGDLTGVSFAYQAAFPDGQGRDEDKKAFFLQYARAWCGIELPKMREQLLKVDPHSRGWARVNQQMKNQPEFAKVYSCQKTDPMVLPESDIVRIW